MNDTNLSLRPIILWQKVLLNCRRGDVYNMNTVHIIITKT